VFFIQQANQIRVSPTKPHFICHEELPAKTYAVKVDEAGFFLEEIGGFTLPPKLYGNATKHRDRILNTFEERPAGTGVFLEGEKGSGKTLLGKAISLEGLKRGYPTIVINTPFAGEAFNTFIASIRQPKVIFFDEFEKIYDEDKGVQEQILTLFDGVYPTKALFIVTVNDSWRVDSHMKNRPGRLYYMLKFDGLDRAFVKEYAEENLNDKTQVEGVLSVATLFRKFNFDMLKALIEEMNRYNESAREAMTMLNTKPTSGDMGRFDITLFVDGKIVKNNEDAGMYVTEQWSGDPLTTAFRVDQISENATGRREHQARHLFEPDDLIELNGADGTFIFEKGRVKVVLQRQEEKTVDYTKYIM
jgi:hypothetical protein